MLFVISLFPGSAQEQSEADKKIMETWMKYATPGEGHAFLKKMAGEWVVVSKLWEKPGREPTLTNGPGKAKMIMGGRYLEITYQGTMMGMPFEGKSLYGYDNHAKKYFSTWIDNMGTGLMVTWGTVDKTGKILTEFGEVDDIFTGKKIKVKNVITLIDADKWQTEMYMLDPQGEFKSVEVIHTRKK
jgi:predicted DNA-binding WGR domain protein